MTGTKFVKLRDQGIKAVIFDLDDTLLYTVRNGFRKCCVVAQQLQLKPLCEDQFREVYGLHAFHDCVKIWYPSLSEPSLFQILYDQLRDCFPDIPIGNFRTIVERGKAAGLLMGIVTNSPAEKTLRKLRALNMSADLLDGVWHAGNLPALKPDPRALFPVCAVWKVACEEVLYVGDSLTDFLAAQRAGMTFCAVLTGNTTQAAFLEHLSADQIMSCIDDLLDRL